jgi:molybdate transport system permease protein
MLLSAQEWGVVALSAKVSGVAIAGVLPIAFALAWALARGRFRGRVLLDALVHLPLVLPPVVIGWMLLVAFAPAGLLGGWLWRALGVTLLFRWTGAALAAAIMALPLMVRAIRLSLEAVDPRLEQAARTLGAGPWATFWRVTLPLCAPGIVAGAVLGFARSLGNSARRSRSCPTFRVKPRPCRWRSMPRCRCPAAMRRCGAWRWWRWCSRWWRWSPRAAGPPPGRKGAHVL